MPRLKKQSYAMSLRKQTMKKRLQAKQREREGKIEYDFSEEESFMTEEEKTKRKQLSQLAEEKWALRRKKATDRQKEQRVQRSGGLTSPPIRRRRFDPQTESAVQNQNPDIHYKKQKRAKKIPRSLVTEEEMALRRKRQAELKRQQRLQMSEEERELNRKKATERSRELRRLKLAGLHTPIRRNRNSGPIEQAQVVNVDVVTLLNQTENLIEKRNQWKLGTKEPEISKNEDDATQPLVQIRAFKMTVEALKMATMKIIKTCVKSTVERLKGSTTNVITDKKKKFVNIKIKKTAMKPFGSKKKSYKYPAPYPNSYKEILPIPFNLENKSFVCFVCNCGFEALKGVKLHLPSHTALELLKAKEKYEKTVNPPDGDSKTQEIIFTVYTCEICSDKSYSLDYYRMHLTEKHKDNKEILSKMCFPCSFCPEVTIARHILMMHLEKSHDIFTQCPICNENFEIQASFASHLEIHSDADLKNENERVFEYENAFFCKTCGYCSRRYQSVASHTKDCQPVKPVCLECVICQLKCDSKMALRRHQRESHGNEIFFCEPCGKQFKSALCLKSHNERFHNPNTTVVKKQEVICEHCGKVFASQSTLRVHDLATHQGRRAFPCNVCGMEFSCDTVLRQHKITICEKEKAIAKECPTCGKVLANYILLSHHKMNIHKYGNTEENVCHICDRTFKDSFVLYMHNNSNHSGKEPVVCSLCKKSFSEKKLLLDHWRSHLEERPVKCSSCQATFKRKKDFYSHRRHVHAKEKDDVTCVVDTEAELKVKSEFQTAHATQFITMEKKHTTSRFTLKTPTVHQNNISTIEQTHEDEEMPDFGNDEDLFANIFESDSDVTAPTVKNLSNTPRTTDTTSKSYMDFSRADVPEMRIVLPKQSTRDEPVINHVVVQGNVPKGTTSTEDKESVLATMKSSISMNDFSTADPPPLMNPSSPTGLPSPMDPSSPMEYSDTEVVKEDKKPFIFAAGSYLNDPFPKRLVVELERLWACVVCNNVFPTLVVYREHMKSKSHRAAMRVMKREDIVDRDWEKSKEEELRRRIVNVQRNKKQSSNKKYKERDLKYQCAFCPEKFPSVGQYRKHRREHVKRATCLNCSEKFVGDRELVSHYISEHKEEHIIKCEQCDMGFLDYKSELLRVHVRRQHLNKKQIRDWRRKDFNCDICGEKMVGLKVLGSHMLVHNEDKNKCIHCPEEFQGYTDLENHYKDVHNGDMPCPCGKCPQKFLTQFRLLLHEQNYHGRKREVQRKTDGNFPCPFCDEMFTVLKTYTQHVKHHKATFECLLCPQKFSFVRKLVDHYILDHNGQKIIRCEICDKAFLDYNERSLEGHMQRIHQGKKRKQKPANRFPCDICGVKLGGLKLLKAHLLKHNEEKQKCVHCKKEFDGVNALENHYKEIHDGDMPFQCTECPKKYSIEYRLEVHNKTDHSSPQSRRQIYCEPGVCDICGKVVTREYDLPKHKATHMPEEERHKFFCEFCGKSFLHKFTLTLHTRSHTGEKPYACKHCERGFTTLDILKTHVRRAHNIPQ